MATVVEETGAFAGLGIAINGAPSTAILPTDTPWVAAVTPISSIHRLNVIHRQITQPDQLDPHPESRATKNIPTSTFPYKANKFDCLE
ncbi:hypothetical protein [Burkholderia sp. Bp8963]|uniref:hypothetical protein n=1 Tax=Burkholderia sp. Bp8963 TaxID=2184547 RepID=UPI000F5B6D74|nr:hypothetical protein [Burkholderia sp. Bp8963]